MKVFRRSPPRQAGLVGGPPLRPLDTRPAWGEVGIHGVARPREWDTVVLARADIEGRCATFVALADGTVVVEEGPEDVAPLAEAVSSSLPPPYRAEAVRRPGGAWSVGANRIRVVELAPDRGDDLRLTVSRDGRELVVDGVVASPAAAPALDELVERIPAVVHARRLVAGLYEVTVHTL